MRDRLHPSPPAAYSARGSSRLARMPGSWVFHQHPVAHVQQPRAIRSMPLRACEATTCAAASQRDAA